MGPTKSNLNTRADVWNAGCVFVVALETDDDFFQNVAEQHGAMKTKMRQFAIPIHVQAMQSETGLPAWLQVLADVEFLFQEQNKQPCTMQTPTTQ